MAVNDVIMLRLDGDYQGQNWSNVFFYRQTAAGCANEAQALWNAFNGTPMTEITDFMNDEVNVTSLLSVIIRAPNVYYQATPTRTAGQRAGTSQPAPSYMAGSIRFNRNGPGSRYSYKRFVGVLEEDFSGNATESAAIALLNAIGDALVVSISNGGCTYEPVQVASGWTYYTQPTVNHVINENLAARVTTQNSRKAW